MPAPRAMTSGLGCPARPLRDPVRTGSADDDVPLGVRRGGAVVRAADKELPASPPANWSAPSPRCCLHDPVGCGGAVHDVVAGTRVDEHSVDGGPHPLVTQMRSSPPRVETLNSPLVTTTSRPSVPITPSLPSRAGLPGVPTIVAASPRQVSPAACAAGTGPSRARPSRAAVVSAVVRTGALLRDGIVQGTTHHSSTKLPPD